MCSGCLAFVLLNLAHILIWGMVIYKKHNLTRFNQENATQLDLGCLRIWEKPFRNGEVVPKLGPFWGVPIKGS